MADINKTSITSRQVKKIHLDYALDGVEMNFTFPIERRREIRAAIKIFEQATNDLKEVVKTIPSQEE